MPRRIKSVRGLHSKPTFGIARSHVRSFRIAVVVRVAAQGERQLQAVYSLKTRLPASIIGTSASA